MNDAHARVIPKGGIEQRAGIVGRTVVDDDDVKRMHVGGKHGGHRLHHDAFFVVRGNQHGDGGLRHGHHGVVRAKLFDQRKNANDERAGADQDDANNKNRGDGEPEPLKNGENETIRACLESFLRRERQHHFRARFPD